MSTKAVMVPQKYERYVNIYWENGAPNVGTKVFPRQGAADAAASSGRIACLKIIVTTELA